MRGQKIVIIGAALLAVVMLMAVIPVRGATADDFNFSGTDPAGDVTDPNVDLISAQVTSDGTDVIFTLTVSGAIVADSYDYTYSFGITDTNYNMLGVTFYNNNAEYVSNLGTSNVPYTVSGNTLEVRVPLAAFSAFQTPFTMVGANAESDTATDSITMAFNYGGGDTGSGDSGGSSGYEEEKCPDPTTETPTDTSISVKITEVKITFEKTDDGQNMHTIMIIKGTTSGVDHVSLNVVWYYKNGTHEWGWSWMRGPMSPPPFTPPGVVINKMSFQSTSGNWNTWELNIDVIQPIMYMEGNYSGAVHMSDISKVRIYARAYADAEETLWNQAYYEFTPSVSASEDSMTYDSTQESSGGSSGGGLPGFEALVAVGALSAATLFYSRKRK